MHGSQLRRHSQVNELYPQRPRDEANSISYEDQFNRQGPMVHSDIRESAHSTGRKPLGLPTISTYRTKIFRN